MCALAKRTAAALPGHSNIPLPSNLLCRHALVVARDTSADASEATRDIAIVWHNDVQNENIGAAPESIPAGMFVAYKDWRMKQWVPSKD